MTGAGENPEADLKTVGRQLARGGFTAMAIQGSAVGLAFCSQLLLSRFMGPASYGEFAFVIVLLLLAVRFCMAGWDTTLVRYIPKYVVEEEPGALRGLIRIAQRSAVFNSCLATAIGAVALGLAWIFWQPQLALTFAVALPALAVSISIELSSAMFQGLKLTGLSRAYLILRPLFLLAGCAALVVIGGAQLVPASAMVVYLGSSVVVLLVLQLILRRTVRADAHVEAVDDDAADWRKMSWIMLLLVTFTSLLENTDVILLGALQLPKGEGMDNVGIYYAAGRLAAFVPFGFMSFMVLGMPMISQVSDGKQKERMQEVSRNIALGGAAFAIPVSLIFCLAPRWCLSWFGAGFETADSVLVTLAIGQVANASLGPVGGLLVMSGHEHKTAAVIGACTVLNIALNIVLIPLFGIFGAATATTVSRILWKVLLVILVVRLLRIDPTILSAFRPISK